MQHEIDEYTGKTPKKYTYTPVQKVMLFILLIIAIPIAPFMIQNRYQRQQKYKDIRKLTKLEPTWITSIQADLIEGPLKTVKTIIFTEEWIIHDFVQSLKNVHTEHQMDRDRDIVHFTINREGADSIEMDCWLEWGDKTMNIRMDINDNPSFGSCQELVPFFKVHGLLVKE